MCVVKYKVQTNEINQRNQNPTSKTTTNLITFLKPKKRRKVSDNLGEEFHFQ